MSIYEKPLYEPWFTLTKLGIKEVEGTLNRGDFANMKVGDTIIFTNNELGFERKIEKTIKSICFYETLQSYLEKETLEKCLPGIDNIEDATNVCNHYLTKASETNYTIKSFVFC